MVKDGEANVAKDRAAREHAEARNRADSLLYAAEKSLRDLGDLGDRPEAAEARREVATAAADLAAALEADDARNFSAKVEALQQASHRLAELVYRDAGGDAGPQAAGGTGSAGARPGERRRGAKAAGRQASEDVDYEVVDGGDAT